MKNRKLIALATAATMMLLTACGGGQTADAPAADEPAAEAPAEAPTAE